MNWSFIIISNPANPQDLTNLTTVVESIKALQIPTYEILLVGPFDTKYNTTNFHILKFDENIKKGWITNKKNWGAQQAKYDNLCILHDYISFNKDWYLGYEKFGNDWNTCCNKILNPDNSRHSDWLISPMDVFKIYPELEQQMPWNLSLPYETTGLTKIQYYSGNYFCVKKQFMLGNPLNEELMINEAEDIEWSQRIRQKTEFKFNINSTNHILKPNKWAPKIIDPMILETVKRANGL